MRASYAVAASCGLYTFKLLRQIEQLRRCEIISELDVKQLCLKAREILAEESNVQRIDTPVTVRTGPSTGQLLVVRV